MNLNLYKNDKSAKKDEFRQKLINCFENPCCENIKNSQNFLKTYTNLCVYQEDSNNRLKVQKIESLLGEYIPFMDLRTENFIKDFPENYGSRLFELVMARKFSSAFNLNIRENKNSSLPDLEIEYNQKIYFIECTTRFTSSIDKIIRGMRNYDNYYKILEILYKSYLSRKKDNLGGEHWDWCFHIQAEWRYLSEDNRNLCKKILQVINENELIILVQEWLNAILNFVWCFLGVIYENFGEKKLSEHNFIPEYILNDLNKLALPLQQAAYNEFNMNFFYKNIANAILSKVSKEYFTHDTPVIIAFSLATLWGSIAMVTDPVINMSLRDGNNFLQKAIEEILANEIDKFSEETIKKIKKNIENIYAIIVDKYWITWIPELMNLNNGYEDDINLSNFDIIYNSEHWLVNNNVLILNTLTTGKKIKVKLI